jgi:hypothetical protein
MKLSSVPKSREIVATVQYKIQYHCILLVRKDWHFLLQIGKSTEQPHSEMPSKGSIFIRQASFIKTIMAEQQGHISRVGDGRN